MPVRPWCPDDHVGGTGVRPARAVGDCRAVRIACSGPARITRPTRAAQPRPMGEPQTGRFQHLLRRGNALEVPGRPDHFDLGIPFPYADEGRQHGPFLFYGTGATRHDDRLGRGQAEFTAQRFPPGALLSGGQVELDVSGHTHPDRVRAKGDEALSVERMLDAHDGQPPQHGPEKRLHETVSRETAIRHAAIDQGHGAIVGGCRPEHAGPEFPFEQNQCAGAYPPEHPADDERCVEGRQSEIPAPGDVLPGIGQAGFRHRGDQHLETGMAFRESFDHRSQAGGFAHGCAVEPDDRPVFTVGDERALAESLAHPVPVQDGQAGQDRREQDGQRGIEQGVDKDHVRDLPVRRASAYSSGICLFVRNLPDFQDASRLRPAISRASNRRRWSSAR